MQFSHTERQVQAAISTCLLWPAGPAADGARAGTGAGAVLGLPWSYLWLRPLIICIKSTRQRHYGWYTCWGGEGGRVFRYVGRSCAILNNRPQVWKGNLRHARDNWVRSYSSKSTSESVSSLMYRRETKRAADMASHSAVERAWLYCIVESQL